MDPNDDPQPETAASDAEASSRAADAGAAPPDAARVVVWNVPAAIERGKRFDVRIGIACSSARRPDGWRVEVRDHEGGNRATATVGEEPWPGTDALYHAEVALVAPEAEGLYTWEAAAVTRVASATGVRSATGGTEEPGGVAETGGAAESLGVLETGDAAEPGGVVDAQTGGRARFGVRVVSAPDCLVTVTAVDAESGTPVEGARVVAHPYRTVTDARGVAELRVPAGEYRLFVSGKGCIPFRFDGEVTADTRIRAELDQDRELSDADIWS